RVGGQARLLVGVKGVDGLDEADGADGNQVVRVFARVVKLLHDVGHEAKVALDQDVAGLTVAGRHPLQQLRLLLAGQRLGEDAVADIGRNQHQAVQQGSTHGG